MQRRLKFYGWGREGEGLDDAERARLFRFVAEKLVWEAEAHRYEAALALFERAAGELDHTASSGDAGRTIVRALGRAALDENEYWLRTHRERPVEQAVG